MCLCLPSRIHSGDESESEDEESGECWVLVALSRSRKVKGVRGRLRLRVGILVFGGEGGNEIRDASRWFSYWSSRLKSKYVRECVCWDV